MDKNYEHDCESCTFLGKDIEADSGTLVDMYFCSQNDLPSIVMRYGDEGSEYMSVPIQIINKGLDEYSETPLVRNMLIAEDKKLWVRY